MKYFIALCFLCLLSCTNKQKEARNSTEESIPMELRPSVEKHPVMKFDQPVVYLGKITEGDSISYTFHFKNEGNMPLKILTVNASCGCTTPKWSKELVMPGKKGFIKVSFDSKGKEGKVQKTVTAYCNTMPSDNMVTFKVEIDRKK